MRGELHNVVRPSNSPYTVYHDLGDTLYISKEDVESEEVDLIRYEYFLILHELEWECQFCGLRTLFYTAPFTDEEPHAHRALLFPQPETEVYRPLHSGRKKVNVKDAPPEWLALCPPVYQHPITLEHSPYRWYDLENGVK